MTDRLVIERRAFLAGIAGIAAVSCNRRGPHDGLALGYMTNITHAQPLVGAQGRWQKALGSKTTVMAFGAGPAVMEALSAGSLDVAFLGPAPVVNAYVRSGGSKMQVVAGACAGGSSLVARTALKVTGPRDLQGLRIASPQIASSPDVALRAYLLEHGITTTDRGGATQVVPMTNADALLLLARGALDAAWAPEPWATRMLREASCERILDERDLWPNRRFPTTVMVASKRALETMPEAVGQVVQLLEEETERLILAGPAAVDEINDALAAVTQKRLNRAVLADAMTRFELTTDPIAESFPTIAAHMREVGYLPEGTLDGLLATNVPRSRRG